MAQNGQCRNPKIVILYASYGEGHLQAARAIRDSLEKNGAAQTMMIDLMAESHPWLNEMTKRFYLKSYSRLPLLYGWMYEATRPMKHNSLFGGLLHSLGRDTIRRLLAKEKPDAVIHTFPLFALPTMQKRNGKRKRLVNDLPSYAVVTDFDLHRRWVHPNIDRYYVATEDMKQELGRLGIRANRVEASGIPLKSGFHGIAPSPELYRKFGLQPNKPIILIMAGAHGVMPDIKKLCRRLLEQDGDVQVVLVCGRNAELVYSVEAYLASHPQASRLKLFGYVEQIYELMAVATVLVTKPGGITLSEAIAAGLPMFIHRPVPGQERQNAFYLQSKGAAFISSKPEQLLAGLLELLANPEQLRKCREAVGRLQRSDASADYIARDILTRLEAADTGLFSTL
ncbi:glycosyltransferase [Paenibacillus sp. NPDC058071]|uniref:MGDG synthase family glycosyltransferase n=1 Tax=Paenibacillus sp. NPDC058071 TaxID=3346326 RepID=UPI0036DE7E57